MWFNRLLKLLLKTKPNVNHWWRETGESNMFILNVTIKYPCGTKVTKWVSSVQLNGEMSLAAQSQVMARMCWALDLSGNQ